MLDPPPEAYCPCCKRLSDCCICNAGNAAYHGEECKVCRPVSSQEADEPIIVEAK